MNRHWLLPLLTLALTLSPAAAASEPAAHGRLHEDLGAKHDYYHDLKERQRFLARARFEDDYRRGLIDAATLNRRLRKLYPTLESDHEGEHRLLDTDHEDWHRRLLSRPRPYLPLYGPPVPSGEQSALDALYFEIQRLREQIQSRR